MFGDHHVKRPVERLRLGASLQELLSAPDFGDIEPEMLVFDSTSGGGHQSFLLPTC
jgi:hypothetical protein